MADEIKHGNPEGHGDYERRDIGVTGIFYFIVGLAVATFFVHLLLAGLYDVLDKRARSLQPPVNPLIENVPTDTRNVPARYPEKAFPEPRLERDERDEIYNFRVREEETLNSYGWVDEKAGTVRIPIERAMELEAQRLAGRSADSNSQRSSGATDTSGDGTNAKTMKKPGNKKKGI
ncbi:MAG: hypothetical protein WB729_00095 [Candidatus Sulfotelmatobacter sp.]